MRATDRTRLVAVALLMASTMPAGAFAVLRVTTASGVVEATTPPNGITAFKGIPFAAPPVGDLRWKPPQPVKSWDGVRAASQFGPRCMQHPVFGDMAFRSNGMSEDCLYLNVWTPMKTGSERLPVLVYFFGGGFVAGDGSESRYDGESMARRGIVAVTVNYRLGVFGFLAHPELTKESPHHASGNYAYLDQHAALQWVQQNIAKFGGDPAKVTIAGESAGSLSVSAQMASPLSKGLIAGAIGESGALINPTLGPVPLADAEQEGVKFANSAGAPTLAALRALPTAKVHEAQAGSPVGRFPSTVDGHFLPKLPVDIFAAGEQAHVPLLVGWNSAEMAAQAVMGPAAPTSENFAKVLQTLYSARAAEAQKLYPAGTAEETLQSATDLASDRFIAYSTWKWFDLHRKTAGQPVYRYLYARPRPPMRPEMGNATPGLAGGVVSGQRAPAAPPPPARGAVHSAEIEYAMGNLDGSKVYAWTPDDYKVSEVMQGYFANFVKTGDPNGPGLPPWPRADGANAVQIMRLDVQSRVEPDRHESRYRFLDQFFSKPPAR
jgi:para-nitrobenzyl esterase